MADTNTLPKDPALVAAELEASLAKARKEKAEAELAIIKAQFSPLTDQSKITAPSGDVTATSDQVGFVETQMLAQAAARVIAKELKHSLAAAKPTTLIIYNSNEIASLSALAVVLKQLAQLEEACDREESNTVQVLQNAQALLAPSQPGAQPDTGVADLLTAAIVGPSIVTGVVKSVAELVNMFRTTTDFRRQTVSVTDDMIISYLVKHLAGTVTVYYPAVFPPVVTNSADGFVATLERLNDKRLAAQTRIEDLETMKTTLTTSTSAATNSARFKSAIDAIDRVSSNLKSLNTEVEQLIASLRTPDATGKEIPLSQLIRAERLALLMNASGTFTLRLTVTASGTTMTRKNAFINAHVEHSAGVSLIYQLFDVSGKIVNADALQYYFEFQTAKEVRETITS